MDEDTRRWNAAYDRFTSTTAEQQKAITTEYFSRRGHEGATECCLEYAVNKVLGPIPEPEGTSEYEEIIAGEEAWVSTLKNSVS